MANYVWTVVNGVPYNPGVNDFATDQSGTTWRLGYRDPVTGAVTYPLGVDNTGVGTFLSSLVAGGNVQAGSLSGLIIATKIQMLSSANGLMTINNAGVTSGIGFDVTTPDVLKVRTKAQTGYGTVDCLGLSASGAAGASYGPGNPTSITVVNGIVTACS